MWAGGNSEAEPLPFLRRDNIDGLIQQLREQSLVCFEDDGFADTTTGMDEAKPLPFHRRDNIDGLIQQLRMRR